MLNEAQFMLQALALAREGIALCSPNPHVGAVIVDTTGNIIGRGSHRYEALKHAEILALEEAGDRARGSTLYINLEPCSHQGRTPPCADAVTAAGVARVVAAMADPNPQVSGKGFEKLVNAGIAVEVGLMAPEARKINEAFAKYIRHCIPLVTLKTAMTLDGKIAPPPGSRAAAEVADRASSDWITGEAARSHVQELRHENDAILAGIGTVLADDPLLTDRTGRPRRRPLLRVVLDSHLRLPLDSELVRSANDDVLVFCCEEDDKKRKQLESRSVRVEQIAANEGHPDLRAVLTRLGELEMTSLLIEGGSQVNAAALASGVVDKVFLYYAPKFLGADAVPFASGPASSQVSDALQLRCFTLHRFADDFAVEGYLRDPYLS
ncbi:MAG TPA: bifunctional diaminohydroxyphosphoribosylaminopyrimidine deaminase/5-amino-6-(5-phosphoribosylamino)uracil reductase RibD [Terriglobales bacterium]|nr:bifunctional diaminohydroxyphosphoribosylaminopyrimidine deaminase/5-amino-6-(5-phosphoribosylamino)uracil reductase RibD [Terriglobales bacterium]